MTLDLTEQEFAALINLLDVALKSSGVGGLLAKVQAAQSEKTEEVSGHHTDAS